MLSRRPALAVAVVAGLALTGTALSQGHDSAGSVAPTARTLANTQASPSTQASRQWHRFRGRVTQANSPDHWFRMRTSSSSVRIHTRGRTVWDGCDWNDMDPGYRVDVRAYRQHHMWMAQRIQNWRGGGHDGWGH